MTPIEKARNIGPVVSEALRASGIHTVEQLRELGWREAWQILCEHFPRYDNLNCAYGLAGAELDIDWRLLDPHLKAEMARIRKQRRSRPSYTR